MTVGTVDNQSTREYSHRIILNYKISKLYLAFKKSPIDLKMLRNIFTRLSFTNDPSNCFSLRHRLMTTTSC